MEDDQGKKALKDIEYSEPIYDGNHYEYRQVKLSNAILQRIPWSRLMEEHEWKALGIEQPSMWVHCANQPPNAIVFQRPVQREDENGTEPRTVIPEKNGDKKKRKEDKWKRAIPKIQYSEKYYDEKYEYRHVALPRIIVRKFFPLDKLLEENEWRAMGIQQSRGWEHYAVHRPEPEIMLFRRPRQRNNNVEEIKSKQQPIQQTK